MRAVEVIGVPSVWCDVLAFFCCTCHGREALHKTDLNVVVDDNVSYWQAVKRSLWMWGILLVRTVVLRE